MSTADQRRRERVLYGFWLSPYMALVAHFLKESNLKFRYERVSAYLGSTHADQHKRRNPLAKVPSLRDANGLTISESLAICRYLARTYPESQQFYPCDDAAQCAAVDAKNDFITFSISGPFFDWFVVGAYFPQAFRLKTEEESRIFSSWSVVMITGNIRRLIAGSAMDPFIFGQLPCLPDFHLFHILELGKTFSAIFDMPMMDLAARDATLQRFYDAMAARPSTKEILIAQSEELPVTRREIFENFGDAYEGIIKDSKRALRALFGHAV